MRREILDLVINNAGLAKSLSLFSARVVICLK